MDNIEVLHLVSTTFSLFALFLFILAMLSKILDYRIKIKIVEKGVPESLAGSLFTQNGNETKYAPFKWFALLAGAGAGFTIVNFTLPLGIHSIAIMCFSIAASFLAYYFFVRKTEAGRMNQ